MMNLYPNLSIEQLFELNKAFMMGVNEYEIMYFANPQLSAELMSLACADIMDGYYVQSWLDLDFSNEELIKRRNMYHEETLKKKQTVSMKI